jgi:hypothetical protein
MPRRRRMRLTINDLIKVNKEEIIKDKEEIEKIEKRLDEKHNKKLLHYRNGN